MSNDSFILAINNLRERKLRSWLTILGIVIGIAAVVTLIFIGNGLENAIHAQFSKMGISNIRVMPGNLRGPPTGGIGFNNSMINQIEKVKSVEYVNPILLNFATVEYGNEEKFYMTVGYDTDLSERGFLDADIKLDEGRFFNEDEKGSVLIGYNIANDEFKNRILSKNNIKLNRVQYKVIGVFEDTGTDIDNRIYLPLDDARNLFDKHDIVNALTVKIKDGVDIEKAAEDVRVQLRKNYEEEEFVVFTPEQLLEQLRNILGAIKILLSGIAAISLVVGGIGIMNSMFTSVLERRREIGIMKAVGATNRQVLLFFLVESGLIGAVGGILGIVLGIIVAKSVELIAAQLGFSLLAVGLDFNVIIVMLLFAFFVGMISGAIPAYQAAKLKPVEALRYE